MGDELTILGPVRLKNRLLRARLHAAERSVTAIQMGPEFRRYRLDVEGRMHYQIQVIIYSNKDCVFD